MSTFTLSGYAEFLRGYATARLGPGKHQQGAKTITVEVRCDPDAVTFSVHGYFYRKGDAQKIELAPIHISRKEVEDNYGPVVLDERLPLWRAAADATTVPWPPLSEGSKL